MTEEEIKRKIYNKAQHLTWEQFEYFCADVIERCGYRNVKVTRPRKDGGVDIYADAHDKNFHFFHVCFQVKKYRGSWNISVHQAESFVNSPGYKQTGNGAMISLNGYNKNAVDFNNQNNVKMLDGKDLIDLAYKYGAGYNKDGSIDNYYWQEIARRQLEAVKKK